MWVQGGLSDFDPRFIFILKEVIHFWVQSVWILILRPSEFHKTQKPYTLGCKMYGPRVIKDKKTPKVGKSDQSPTIFPLTQTNNESPLGKLRHKCHKKAPFDRGNQIDVVVAGQAGTATFFLRKLFLLFLGAGIVFSVSWSTFLTTSSKMPPN